MRAVLLDGLGTLLALAPPWPAFAWRLRSEHGLQLAEADAERAFRAEIAYYRAHHHEGRDAAALADLRRRCAQVLRDELPTTVADALSTAQLTAAMLASLCFSAYPDAPPALAALRARGLRLVVVSNWDSSLPTVLTDVGLAGALDGVLTSATVGAPKPAPAIFAAALALAGVAPGQAVHVGDSVTHDVAGARAAGIAPVLLRRAGEGVGRDVAEGDLGEGNVGRGAVSDPAAARAQVPLGVSVIASLSELLT
ncbi:MAG TPA: HAD-IA family hydrolase [Solirubrobacteraceae bacterium]|nr:HAD-IA family hydrolase [Solirubrobacteraceae bacterium]